MTVDTMRRIMVLFRGRIRRWREDKPGGLAVAGGGFCVGVSRAALQVSGCPWVTK